MIQQRAAAGFSFAYPVDNAKNRVASFSATALTKVIAAAQGSAPVVQFATITGNVLTAIISRPLDGGSVPGAHEFIVQVAGEQIANKVVNVAFANTSLILTLERAVAPGEGVLLEYRPAGQTLRSSDPNNPVVAPFKALVHNHTPVENDQFFAPRLLASWVGTGIARLFFDKNLNNTKPANDALTVTVNGARVNVTNIAIAGNTATLTLASAVAAGDAVTVAYAQPAANAGAFEDNIPVYAANAAYACPRWQGRLPDALWIGKNAGDDLHIILETGVEINVQISNAGAAQNRVLPFARIERLGAQFSLTKALFVWY